LGPNKSWRQFTAADAPAFKMMDKVQSLVTWVQDNPRATAVYGLFIAGCLAIYKLLEARATGKYDHVLTLSAGLQALAFALLALEARSEVGEGLSEKSLWAFFIAHVSRLSTTFWGEAYVPEDNTSDFYLYQVLETAGLVFVGFQMVKLNTFREGKDVGQGLERWSVLAGMVVAAVVLAALTKNTGHNDWLADLMWMFSVWLEAFAFAPQVQLMMSNVTVDESQFHFCVLSLAAGITFAVFWGHIARMESESLHGDERWFWRGIFGAGLVRVSLSAGYLYLFVQAARGFKRYGQGRGDYDPFVEDIL